MLKIQPPTVIDFQPAIAAKDKDDKSIVRYFVLQYLYCYGYINIHLRLSNESF